MLDKQQNYDKLTSNTVYSILKKAFNVRFQLGKQKAAITGKPQCNLNGFLN